jgi:hypothetical protein
VLGARCWVLSARVPGARVPGARVPGARVPGGSSAGCSSAGWLECRVARVPGARVPGGSSAGCSGAGWLGCRVLECRVLECRVLECRVLWCRVLWCRVLGAGCLHQAPSPSTKHSAPSTRGGARLVPDPTGPHAGSQPKVVQAFRPANAALKRCATRCDTSGCGTRNPTTEQV